MDIAKVKSQKTAICLQLCMNHKEALSRKLVIKTLKNSCNLVLDKNNNLIPFKRHTNNDILKDSPSTCFEEFPGKVLIGVVDQLIKDISDKEQCKQICLETKLVGDVECKAVMYYTKDQTCVLSSETKTTMPELFTSDADSIYIENKCLKKSIDLNTNIQFNETLKVPDNNENNFKISSKILTTTPISFIQTPTIIPISTEITPKNIKISQQQELSGYDAQDPTITANEVKTIFSTTPKNVPVIDSMVIDSYNSPLATTSKPVMNVNKNENKILENFGLPEVTTESLSMNVDEFKLILPSTIKPFLGVTGNEKIINNNFPTNGYKKMYKLRDEILLLGGLSQGCFVSISPRTFSPDVIVKSNSIKQCFEMCKLCKSCINGKDKCEMISFSTKTNHCALSSRTKEYAIGKPNINASLMHFKITNCPQIKN
uniref:Apple domain-containing protein n=1 Tax=Strongyloides papillosus TaxID=174720 RepID=A0A0N5BF41_STREA